MTGFSYLKAALHNLLERALYFFPFDKYICVSNATRKDLLNHGIKPERAITIYNGLDYDFWKPKHFSKDEAQKLRQEMGLDKKFVCLSWGRPGESKGFQYLGITK